LVKVKVKRIPRSLSRRRGHAVFSRATRAIDMAIPTQSEPQTCGIPHFIGIKAAQNRSNPFSSVIKFKGRSYALGSYADVESGARAYDAVARLIPGRMVNSAMPAVSPGDDLRVEHTIARGTWSDATVLAAINAARSSAPSSKMRGSGRPDSIQPGQNGHTQQALRIMPVPVVHAQQALPPATLPPLSRADLIVRVRFKLRLARVDDTTLGIDAMSDSGLLAMLGDLETAPALPLRRPQA
jgi:hypothetical protein